MTFSYITIDKNGTIKEHANAKTLKEDELYKKANYKIKDDDFKKQTTWENVLKQPDGTIQSFRISLYAKKTGRANTENKYDFPPPVDNDLYYGTCLLLSNYDATTGTASSLTVPLWEKIYERLFGGFISTKNGGGGANGEGGNGADDSDEDDDEDEDDDDDDISLTKEGYVKDDFIVGDDDEEQQEEEEEEDDEEEQQEEEEEEPAEEFVPVSKKTTAKKRNTTRNGGGGGGKKTSSSSSTNEIKKSYLDCSEELTFDDYMV